MRLSGKVAIVTGAAHGIGQGIALELVKEGAKVWLCDILEDKLAETRTYIHQVTGQECSIKVVDVSDSEQVNAMVQGVIEKVGTIDILINNAGGVAGQVNQPIENVTDDQWRKIFAINLDGAFNFTRAVATAMKKQHSGAIVNISSGAGRSYSLTGIQAYASAKAGLIGFTRQTARELGYYGIRVNCIAPGFIRSNPASEKQWQAMGEAGQKKVIEGIALRRLGEPEDIGKAAVFFVSEDAKWITGQTISVDGGQWMLG